jgi:hypothetical protein
VEQGERINHIYSGDIDVSGEQLCGERDHPVVLTKVEEFIVDHVSSYREILARTPLSIFDGGKLIKRPMGKKSKEMIPVKPMSHSLGGKDSLTKGVVREGIEKYFSPLNTISARNIGNEKHLGESNCYIVVDGLRVLRAQKSLERVKK